MTDSNETTTTVATETNGFDRLESDLDAIRDALREQGLDGWLLYDLHMRNAVAARLLGRGDLTRRYFVLIPAEGEPRALVHGIEEAPWADWPWAKRRYIGWRELSERLGEMLDGRRVAMEISPADAVPALDLVPAGVVELVREAGADVVASGDLVTRFYARWSEEELASHRRAAAVLPEVAREAFRRIAEAVERGEPRTEGEMHRWVLDRLAERGCGAGADCIVAIGPNAANPHYEARAGGAPIRRGDVVLLDLWSKEAESAAYADQTWMAYVGEEVPDRVAELFGAIRDARDAALAFLRERWSDGTPVQGYEVDDVTRRTIRERGLADAFIHRTGHSIDRATHGMGPNIDNLETHEVRRLIPGVGFSIEPGVYLPDDIGLRTEINVYMGPDGPEVTTPDPQREVWALLGS